MSTPNWDRLWRSAGIQFVAFFVIACVVYGHLPGVSASADELVGFYTADRTRILIAAALLGLNVLNLMWFAAALRNTLSDGGRSAASPARRSSWIAIGVAYTTDRDGHVCTNKEVLMSTQVQTEHATERPSAHTVDLKLEVVVIPVSDVERSTEFYRRLGWRHDVTPPGSGVVQFTPPGSWCSVHFGKNLTTAAPGSARGCT